MRCSKCGYISFDHLDSCHKCHKPMADTELKGTTYPAVAPLFLRHAPEEDVSEVVEEMVDVLDPDLDLLASDDDVEIDFEEIGVEDQDVVMRDEPLASDSGEISLGDDFELSFDADTEPDLSFDEEDLSLDTSRFEDVPVNVQAELSVPPVQLEIPEGLADISDLARPASGAEVKSELDTDLDYGDLELDELDFSFEGQEGGGTDSVLLEDGLADLSLDDLDLSGGLEAPSPPPQAPALPVDDDLDFDLDLGGGAEDDAARKKETDDLSDLKLSLD